MDSIRSVAALAAALALSSGAQQTPTVPQLTIYNDGFAVIRTTLPLDLHPGVNEVTTTDVTRQVEPDSVVLRFTGRPLMVLEQNYDAGVVDEMTLLSRYEGKSIDYVATPAQTQINSEGTQHLLPPVIKQATVVRGGQQAIFVVDGHLQFFRPGALLYPSGMEDLLLKPTLRLQLQSDRAERTSAELGYITGGLSWSASYNLVIPEAPDSSGSASAERGEITGWVTMQNDAGESFRNASVQLMAGNVAKIVNSSSSGPRNRLMMSAAQTVDVNTGMPTEKPLDDFHLYTLPRPVSLLDHEVKQVQLLTAANVEVQRSYQYDSTGPAVVSYGYFNQQQQLGAVNKKVSIRQEFRNSRANHLGLPLPSGRLRLYRREITGQLQFVGESLVPHTPQDQTVSLTSGQAFDLTGDRKQTAFHVDNNRHELDDTFEITLSNAKPQPVTIHAVEHMNRGQNWTITTKSSDFVQKGSTTIDFATIVPANSSAKVTYTVHYSW